MSLCRGMNRSDIKYLFLTGVADTLIGEGQQTQKTNRIPIKVIASAFGSGKAMTLIPSRNSRVSSVRLTRLVKTAQRRTEPYVLISFIQRRMR